MKAHSSIMIKMNIMVHLKQKKKRKFTSYQKKQLIIFKKGKKVGVIATDETCGRYDADSVKSIGSRSDEDTIAHRLYTILREFDDENVEAIYSESFDESGVGQAIMNRLLKAAGHQIIQ